MQIVHISVVYSKLGGSLVLARTRLSQGCPCDFVELGATGGGVELGIGATSVAGHHVLPHVGQTGGVVVVSWSGQAIVSMG